MTDVTRILSIIEQGDPQKTRAGPRMDSVLSVDLG
jgi:hypothetical protein